MGNIAIARALTVFGVGAGAVELSAGGFHGMNLWVAAPLLMGAVLLALFATVRVRGEEIECRWVFWQMAVKMSEVREVRVEIPHLAGSLRTDRGRVRFLLDKGDGTLMEETPMMRYLRERVKGGDPPTDQGGEEFRGC